MTLLLRHLRSNAVAYLALVIALGGTSYAAVQIPNGSVTTKKLKNQAVTAKKIRNNAVTGAKIKARSVGADDLAVGVVPGDGYLFQAQLNASDPPSTPERLADGTRQSVTLPRAGTAHLRFFSSRFSVDCTAGSGLAGLYVDGVPVPETWVAAPADANARALQLQAPMALSAGPHQLTVGIECASGDWSSISYQNSGWSVELAAG